MFSLPECASHLAVPLLHPEVSTVVTGISIDTRTLVRGNFFVALRGSHTDGHEYVAQAMAKGASGALVDQRFWEQRKGQLSSPLRNILAVADTRAALVCLASWHRSRLAIPFAGITGSVGKTSVKEFLSYLASRIYGPEAVLSTKGNLNNELGLPLTLLNLVPSHRFAAAELGASKRGDIKYLCDILQPTAGILTCVAPCHLEGFGSLEGIYDTKLELFESLPENGVAVIPSEDEKLIARTRKLPVRSITVGKDDDAAYKLSEVSSGQGKTSFSLTHKSAKWKFQFPGAVPFMAMNAAFALALLNESGEDLSKLPPYWEDFTLPQGRFSLQPLGAGMTVVFDGYNASPRSFQSAVENFISLSGGGRTVCVAGDMLELGEASQAYHEELGEFIGLSGVRALFAYGAMSAYAARAASAKTGKMHVYHSANVDDIMNPLMEYLRPGDYVLLKASRGMKVEKVLEALKKKFPPEVQASRAAPAATTFQMGS